jgi:hypothetical protein
LKIFFSWFLPSRSSKEGIGNLKMLSDLAARWVEEGSVYLSS